jgi:ESS family glutamate:Na+ symporter
MTISPLLTVLLAVPVLLLGERLVRHVRLLSRTNIPAPVVGGLLVALVVLVVNLAAGSAITFASKVATPWWTWLVMIEPEWLKSPSPAQPLSLPLLASFYVCVGLNSTWTVIRKGSVQVIVFLGVATLLGVVQNFVGVALAKGMGLHPLMGILCGSLTMTGGHGTTLGFTQRLEEGGLQNSWIIGSTMATMGIVVGSLMGGPIGGWLIRHYRLRSGATPAPGAASAPSISAAPAVLPPAGLVTDLRELRSLGGSVLGHLLFVFVMVKAGAWAAFFLAKTGVTFPIHIGSMLFAVAVRNVVDLVAPGWIRSEIITPIGSVFLALFLVLAMMGLNLAELTNAALPMLVILAVQVLVMVLFAIWVTFRLMGRDYEAAQMAAGHCGFGIGNTANAVASMKTLVEKYGPAPRAFLVIPLVGGMLGDLTNALNVSAFLKWLS